MGKYILKNTFKRKAKLTAPSSGGIREKGGPVKNGMSQDWNDDCGTNDEIKLTDLCQILHKICFSP